MKFLKSFDFTVTSITAGMATDIVLVLNKHSDSAYFFSFTTLSFDCKIQGKQFLKLLYFTKLLSNIAGLLFGRLILVRISRHEAIIIHKSMDY